MYYSTWQSVIVTVTNVTVVAQSHQVVVADEIYVAFTVVGSHKVAVHNTCTLASCYRFIRVIRG
jgi:hypothetical protein